MADFIETSEGLVKVAPRTYEARAVSGKTLEGKAANALTDALMRKDCNVPLLAYILAGHGEIQVDLVNLCVAYLTQLSLAADGDTFYDPAAVALSRKIVAVLPK